MEWTPDKGQENILVERRKRKTTIVACHNGSEAKRKDACKFWLMNTVRDQGEIRDNIVKPPREHT